MMKVLRLWILIAALGVTACASAPLHKAVPEAMVSSAVVDGFPADIRAWADEPAPNLAATIERRLTLYRETHADYFKANKTYPDMNYLALSGGSNNGAYGAGLLCGWTKAGTRPEFSIVTGVSTGALIAPFAFLGSQYDEALKREYTTVKSTDIFMGDAWTAFRGLTGGMALVDSSPLKARMDKIITPQLVAEIAAEYAKGRRLLIITTNLEAQRGVIWNIGKIASINNPKSLELIKNILLASAAVPGIFEPVLIDVNIGGKQYQEIHVDGGVTSQVFLFPLKSARIDKDAFSKYAIKRNLYIIRNGKISPDYEEIKPAVLSLSERSIGTMVKYQGIGDLYRLYLSAQRDGLIYNLAYIPPGFNEQSKETFDPAYMTKLFELGYKTSQSGHAWYSEPPGVGYAD